MARRDDDDIPPGTSHVVEAYSDSDWGSVKTPDKARRKSTSSGIIVLHGIQIEFLKDAESYRII